MERFDCIPLVIKILDTGRGGTLCGKILINHFDFILVFHFIDKINDL